MRLLMGRRPARARPAAGGGAAPQTAANSRVRAAQIASAAEREPVEAPSTAAFQCLVSVSVQGVTDESEREVTNSEVRDCNAGQRRLMEGADCRARVSWITAG